jgi:hypothetical protein
MLSANSIIVRRLDSETWSPTIIGTHRARDVSVTLIIEDGLEVLSTDVDIRLSVIAVGTIGRAFLARDLHHANLACTSSDRGVAAGFLEGDGCEEDFGDARVGGGGLEHGEILSACIKGRTTLVDDFGEVAVDEVREGDRRRDPTIAIDTAVDPVLVAVWTTCGSGRRNSIRIAALSAGSYDSGTWSRSTIAARGSSLSGSRDSSGGSIRVDIRVGGLSISGVLGDCRVDGDDCWLITRAVTAAIVGGGRLRSSRVSASRVVTSVMMVVVVATSDGFARETTADLEGCKVVVGWLRRGSGKGSDT